MVHFSGAYEDYLMEVFVSSYSSEYFRRAVKRKFTFFLDFFQDWIIYT